MVQPHTGENGEFRDYHIGRIQPTAQSGFNNRQVHFLFFEFKKRNRSHQLKKGWPDSLLGIFIFFKIRKTVLNPFFNFCKG